MKAPSHLSWPFLSLWKSDIKIITNKTSIKDFINEFDTLRLKVGKKHFGDQSDNHQWSIETWLNESISKFNKVVFNIKDVTKGHQEWSQDFDKNIFWT